MQKTVKKAQKGFTLIELLIVIAVIAILAAIAIPNLLASRKAANESSAISSVRTLITAEETYRSRMGQYGSAAQLVTAGLVDATLTAATGKSGYVFDATVAAGSEKTSYVITGTPLDINTGTRCFGSNQTGVIRADVAADPPVALADGAGTPID